jgi:hypothetical protein
LPIPCRSISASRSSSEPKPGGNSTLATAMIPGNQGRS